MTPRLPLSVPPTAGLSVIDAALRYVEVGWFVLPVAAGSHDPGSLLGPQWGTESSSDPEVLARWFQTWPDAGLAVDLGRSGAIAFAIRYTSPVLTAELLQITNEGAHLNHQPSPRVIWYLFALEEGVVLPSGEYGPLEGFGEVLCEGKVAVVAPGPEWKGRRLPVWSAGDLPVLADDVLAELLAPAGTGATATLAHPGHSGHDDPRPTVVPAAKATATSSSWTPVDIGEVLSDPLQPVVPTLMPRDDGECLLYPGKTHIIFGEPESGKSLLSQWACVETMWNSQDVLYIDLESDGASVVRRLLSLGASTRLIGARFTYVRPESDHAAQVDRAAWLELLGRRFALVVIDGVTEAVDLFGSSSIDNDKIAGWMRRVPRELASRTGAAVVLIDHVTKSQEGNPRFPVGAQAKLSSVTGAAYLVKAKSPPSPFRPGRYELRLAKDREGGVRAFARAKKGQLPLAAEAVVTLTSADRPNGGSRISVVLDDPTTGTDDVPGSSPVAPGESPPVVQDRRRRVLDTVREEPGLTQNSLLERLGGNRPAMRSLLDSLEAAKVLRTEQGSRNAKRYFPF